MKNKFDVNEVLRITDFRFRDNYGEIARYCASKQWNSKDEMLADVNEKFGASIVITRKNSLDVKIFECKNQEIDHGAIEQLYTACKLPVAIRGAGMPDLHVGYSLPIGGVVALENAISPAFVGFDIGCQVHCTSFDDTDIPIALMSSNKGRRNEIRTYLMDVLLRCTSFGVGSNGKDMDHCVMHLPEWDEIKFLRDHKDLAMKQLGSSGGGNHFADIVIEMGKLFPNVCLLTHSGSRGIGKKAGEYYSMLAERETRKRFHVPSGYGWFDFSSELGMEYTAVMKTLIAYAKANHEIIRDEFGSQILSEIIESLSCVHNFASLEESMIVHRKGAIPARAGEYGIIPGSSGSYSYIVKGKSNPDSLWSASHGAGRPHSRSEAKKRYDHKKFIAYMEEMEIMYKGVDRDETIDAYKPIGDVIDSQDELISVDTVLKPVVVLMGGSSDDGD